MALPKAHVVPTAVLANGPRQSKDRAWGFAPDLLSDTLVPPLLASRGPSELEASSKDASPDHLYEVGLTTAAMSFHTAAIEALRDCVARAPDHAPAWRKLAELLRLAGEDARAKVADTAALRKATGAAKWKGGVGEQELARLEKTENKIRKSIEGKTDEEAMEALRERLAVEPLHAPAMRLLAQLEATSGDEITCKQLQVRALAVSPNYVGVRQDHVEVLVKNLAYPAAIVHTTWLAAHEPDNALYREQHAHVLMNIGEIDEALAILNGLLRENPNEARYWRAYARVMHFLDRRDESVQALRQCLALQPNMGEAYWALADLKGNYFSEADIAAMRTQLGGDSLHKESRVRMLFALGQALERAGDFSASFAAYDEGRRLTVAHSPPHGDPDRGEPAASERGHQNHSDGSDRKTDIAEAVRCRRVIFSRENLRTRLVQAPAPDAPATPIFVVGLPRAGSTLTEQILSSHSQVEGTRELPLIGDITADLNLSRVVVNRNVYPECVLQMKQEQFAALGVRYLEESRAYRKTDRVWFIDKRPWNWLEVGLIHLMLPQAKIIDIRREPMAACFALFKQLITKFHFDLAGLGRYYNYYVSLMEHWESVLPGRVHFVQYERLVDDTEGEIRRMLDYCGLPFEERCLRFWETDRAVSTPSAQQVRRPIYRDALQQWRNFEPWLGPLKEALAQPAEI